MNFDFKDRPEGGVRKNSPDGIYFFVNGEKFAQLICIGSMPASPKTLAERFSEFQKSPFKVIGVKTLDYTEESKQKVLERGFIDIWLAPVEYVTPIRRPA